MVKLKLQDKKGNQKYFLFDAKKQNHIIFRELNLKNFNILTDVECISESAFGYISIETILTLYKNDKYELRNIFKYIIENNFNYFKIEALEEIVKIFYKKKTIKEMFKLLEENIIILDNDINDDDKYYFYWLKRLIQSRFEDEEKYKEILENDNFDKILGNSIPEMKLKINIKKEDCVLGNLNNEALIVNINKIKEVLEKWLEKN